MKKQKKYVFICQKCGASYDMTGQMEVWKDELFSEIEKVIKKLKSK